MAKTYNLAGSRAGIGSATLTETAQNKTYAVPGVGQVSETQAPAVTYTTWSTTQKDANLTLSGGNLIATASSTNVTGFGVRAADVQSTGKFYWEYTTGATYAGTNNAIGLCNGDVVTYGFAQTLGNVAILNKSGAIWVNSTQKLTGVGAYTTNALICVAVDLAAQLIWFRVGAAGNWNGSAANNPATGVGGVSIAAIAPAYQTSSYPVATLTSNGDSVTANFGATAFSGAVPAGFTSGWTTGSTAITSLASTQVGDATWVTQANAPLAVTQVGTAVWQTQAVAPFWVTQLGASIWFDQSLHAVGGARISTSAGTIATNIVSNATKNLTGAQISISAGNLSPRISQSKSLTGGQITSQRGTLTPQVLGNTVIVSLTGAQIETHGGDLRPPRSLNLVKLYQMDNPTSIFAIQSPTQADFPTSFSQFSFAAWLCKTVEIRGRNLDTPSILMQFNPIAAFIQLKDASGNVLFTGNFTNPAPVSNEYHIAFSVDTISQTYALFGGNLAWTSTDVSFPHAGMIDNT